LASSDPLAALAPAKVNLTLRVLRRRSDGYHELESLVAFADVGDALRFSPGGDLALIVEGPGAAAAGGGDDNLVLKAARALAVRRPQIKLGAFRLDKQLPVAAGLGGGSADAAAALRLLGRANGIALDDPELYAAARATGADVPVCLDPRTRVMRGIGDVLSDPVVVPPLPTVLVNPGVALPTKAVFAQWQPAPVEPAALDLPTTGQRASREEVWQMLATQSNDLEGPAITLRPVIAEVLAALRRIPGCKLARMSGSGATCFGLFSTIGETRTAQAQLSAQRPDWWVKPVTLCA
jgi:4-diphosphocytidyl-2-C-methyl-D-erythritol kinase